MNPIDEILGTDTSITLKLAGWETTVTTKEGLLAAWDTEKDFRIGSQYCSKRDITYLKEEFDYVFIKAFGIEAIKVN